MSNRPLSGNPVCAEACGASCWEQGNTWFSPEIAHFFCMAAHESFLPAGGEDPEGSLMQVCPSSDFSAERMRNVIFLQRTVFLQ